MKSTKQELVILFTDSNEMIVQNVQEILNENDIPSVHISAGTKMPRPVGIKVRRSDLEKALKITGNINLYPLNNIMQPSADFQKTQRLGCFIYLGLGAIYLIYQAIKKVF